MSDNAKIKAVAEPAAGYNDLKYYFANLNTLFSIRSMLVLDMMTAMPSGGLQRRLNDITSINKRIYAETTTSAVTNLLERVQDNANANPENWSEWDRANLREMNRIHAHLSALPPDLYNASVMAASEGHKKHLAALKAKSWQEVLPLMSQTVDLYRKIAALKQEKFGTATPYEALLYGYASDLTEAQVDNLYEALLPPLKDLYKKAIAHQKQQDPPIPLEGECTKGDQMWLNQTLLQMMGFDFNRGTLSASALSPMVGGTIDDVRILVRCGGNHSFLDSLEDTLYQGGRGVYIQNLPPNWKTQPVGQDVGSLIGVSVSILYETILGRTPQFFDFLSVRAEGLFRSFRNKSFETENLYRLKKIIRTTSLRSEADEFSKIFHDILRFRIERDLINGSLSVKDLPDRWRADSKDLLGIEPKNLAEGPLQNPDWFTGRFGFIATNTVSHIIATSLHEKIYQSAPDLPEAIAKGEFNAIKSVLTDQIFARGRTVGALQLIRGITGQDPSPGPLLNHLERRYLSDKR